MISYKKRKVFNIISIVLGITSILMIFVLPFFIPQKFANNKVIAGIYMLVFLTFLGISNKTAEITSRDLTLQEDRDEKISKILK